MREKKKKKKGNFLKQKDGLGLDFFFFSKFWGDREENLNSGGNKLEIRRRIIDHRSHGEKHGRMQKELYPIKISMAYLQNLSPTSRRPAVLVRLRVLFIY